MMRTPSPGIDHFYPDFLTSPARYAASQAHWAILWRKITATTATTAPGVAAQGWTTPWVGTGHPEIRDGNPIFSAWSPSQRRGIRIIQWGPQDIEGLSPEELAERELGIAVYVDYFAGNATSWVAGETETVKELVMSCALTRESEARARELMMAWMKGETLEGLA